MAQKVITPNAAVFSGSEYFADWLRLKLKKSKIPQWKLAKDLGYERKTIMAFINNQRSPRLDTVIAIFDYFEEDSVYIPIRKAGNIHGSDTVRTNR